MINKAPGTAASGKLLPVIIFCLAMLMLLFGCGNSHAGSTDDPSSPTEPTIVPETPSIAAQYPENTPEPTEPPATPSPSPSPSPTAEPTPDAISQEVPRQPSVGNEFFDDAAMLGNSLADGFRLYSGLQNMDVYASTSMTVYGVDSLLASMAQGTYSKIYTFLGINEIYTTPSAFAAQYGKIIDTLQTNHPGADIYIISITPVSKAKELENSVFSLKNIREHNAALYELAGEKGCYYLDLFSAMADAEGYLPGSVTFDGVHFTASQYKVWLDFLKTHYVPGDAK